MQETCTDEFGTQKRYKKLTNFFGERPQTPQIEKFFGQCPHSELISLNLTEYFPGHNSEELERSCKNSVIRASRLLAVSKFFERVN